MATLNTVADLQNALAQYSYAGKTQAEKRAAAELLYKNQLDSAELSAQQSYDKNSLALQNQLNDLKTNYEANIENQKAATVRAKSAADRQALSRGMQRSSYNNATLANLDASGNKALATLDRNYADNTQDISANQTALQNTLSQNLSAAKFAYENNVLAKMNELEQQDYERQTAAQQNQNSLLLQLYQLQQAENKNAASASGGSGSRSGKKPSAGSGDKDKDSTSRDYSDRLPAGTIPGTYKIPVVSPERVTASSLASTYWRPTRMTQSVR